VKEQIKTEHKRWKDNCSTDESGRISRPLNMSKGREILPILPLKLTDGTPKKLQDLVVPKEMTLLNIIHAKQNLFAPQKMNFTSFDDVELHDKRIFIRGILSCKQYQKE
jgi:hypothetical protein